MISVIHKLYIKKLLIILRSFRIFWITMFFLAISGAVRLSLMNWERYIANPTVMSLQKDYRNWYNPFPAATGCFTVRVDEEKGQEYIKKWVVFDYLLRLQMKQMWEFIENLLLLFFYLFIWRKWNIEPENDKYEYYMNFLKTVANVSYYTMQNFTQFNNDKSLEDIDFLDVALKVGIMQYFCYKNFYCFRSFCSKQISN